MKKTLLFFAVLISASCSSSSEKSDNNGDIVIVVGECNGEEIDGSEPCDGIHLGDQTCESQGFGAGELRCMARTSDGTTFGTTGTTFGTTGTTQTQRYE